LIQCVGFHNVYFYYFILCLVFLSE
jgi:hypothetical protein